MLSRRPSKNSCRPASCSQRLVRLSSRCPPKSSKEVPAGSPEADSINHRRTRLRFCQLCAAAATPARFPWLPSTATYRELCTARRQARARGPAPFSASILDSIARSLTAEKLTLLIDPGVEGSFDLVMPLYTTQPFDDLVNKSILYPLTRSLYGHRVQNPLGNEFQMSSKLFPALSATYPRDPSPQQGRLPVAGNCRRQSKSENLPGPARRASSFQSRRH